MNIFISILLLLMLLQMMFFLQYYIKFKKIECLYYSSFVFLNFCYLILSYNNEYQLFNLIVPKSLFNFIAVLSTSFYYFFIVKMVELKKNNLSLYLVYRRLIFFNTFVAFILFILLIFSYNTGLFFFILCLIYLPIYIYLIYNIKKIILPFTKYIVIAMIIIVAGISTTAIFIFIDKYYMHLGYIIINLPSQLGLLSDLIFFSASLQIKNNVVRVSNN